MSTETDTVPVVIVGAGPTGLLLAGELAGAGVRVVVIERDAQPAAMPKANGIVGRAAVELRRRGILAGSGLRVRRAPRFPFGPLGLRLARGPLGLLPLPGLRSPLHLLPVPQRRLEALLERRAVERGAEVRRGTALVGFRQSERGVELELGAVDGGTATGGTESGATTTGGTAHLTAAFLVGCDGARSTVRKTAGIEFPGFTSDVMTRIARVTIPAAALHRDRDGVHLPGVGRLHTMRPNRLPGGGFSIAPVAVLDPGAPDDLYLISTSEPHRGEQPSDALPESELRASLRRVLGAELPFTTVENSRSTVTNSRLASSYRVGRVLLAGDAAHIFNAGGSALNVALLDALDLAPRLAAAAQGRASVASLDSYEHARRPAAERALSQTRAQAALGGDDPQAAALREVVGALTASRAGARAAARLMEGS
jgi:2-polyprenyl-6-methoxyphenol hydroxylase-like FAD-dependent oxidoreductase